jgi:hypothetical protein
MFLFFYFTANSPEGQGKKAARKFRAGFILCHRAKQNIL